MGGRLELRHLKYFVAVAEAGSMTVAATQKLHTAQPSLSRQLRDLEYEVGTPLMTRGARGIELTAAGRAFLDHARLALSQVDAAVLAARRAAQPPKATFALGFLTGQEMDWLPEAMHVLRDELPKLDVTVSSQFSPDLAKALLSGTLDAAFLRPEQGTDDLVFRVVVDEPLVVVLPSDHPLAPRKTIDPSTLAGESFINVSSTAPALRKVIDDYVERTGLMVTPGHEAGNLAMAISLVASTRGFALLPIYAKNFLPWSVVARPIKGGNAPTIPLMVAHHKANTSVPLRLFLSKLDELISRVARKRA
jgi:LysR family transcriptional regulator, hca operon transcriptional activator